MKDELLRLAALCEKAVGPDREIDRSIAQTQGWRHFFVQKDIWWRAPDGRSVADPPRYTASIDVALTLVPEDMRDEIEITTLYCVARVEINMNHGPDGSPFYGNNDCNSIPLAICAAALKARASMEKTDGN